MKSSTTTILSIVVVGLFGVVPFDTIMAYSESRLSPIRLTQDDGKLTTTNHKTILLLHRHHSLVDDYMGTASSSSHYRRTTIEMKSVFQRVFRRGKNRVQTLERDTTTTTTTTRRAPPSPTKQPSDHWRVIMYNSEYMPDRVARVLAKIFPMLARRTAFELCSRARMMGKDTLVVVSSQKEATMYCTMLQQYGLTATMEPHDIDTNKG